MMPGYGISFLGGIISLGLTVWLITFTILVLSKLDKIIEALNKK